MSRMSGIAAEAYTPLRNTLVPKEKQNGTEKEKTRQIRTDRDSHTITYTGVSKEEQALQEIRDQIQAAHPNVHISFTELNGDDAISKHAASLSPGTYLAIDPDFVRWMAAGPEAYQQGMDAIQKILQQLAYDNSLLPQKDQIASGAVIGENGEISYWQTFSNPKTEEESNPYQYLLDSLKDWQETREAEKKAQKSKPTVVIRKKIGYSSGRDMARLARLSTQTDVRSLISKVYARSVAIKGNSRYDKEEVRMTVTQMEGVIARARSKVKHLKEEAQMEIQRKRSIEQQKQEKALQIAIQLRKKQTERRSREHAQIFEKFPYIPQSIWNPRRMDGKLDPDEQPLSGDGITAPIPGMASVPTVSTSAAVVAPTGSGAVGGGAATTVVSSGGAVPMSINIVV